MKIKKAMRIFPVTEEMKNLIVCDEGKATEHYIDPRTAEDSNFNRVVYPLADNDFYYCYVCPNCQRIHIRPKRMLIPDDEGKAINKPDYFQIPEHELPVEYILEWKTQTEDDNNMVMVNDTEGMTVYNPSVNMMVFGLHTMTLATRNRELVNSFDTLITNARPDLWDEDVKKC